MFKWCYVIVCSVFIASGGVLLGYDVGSTNGVKEMEGFREFFNLSGIEENTTCRANDDEETSTLLGLIVSLLSLGSLVGGLLGGLLSDWAGRRATLVTGAVLYATGVIVQTSSLFIWMLLIGRIWTGVGNGVLLQVIALYIAELSPKHLRGKLVSLVSGGGNLGVIIAALVNEGIEGLEIGWRISFGLQFFIICIVIISSPFLPESPRWHIKKNKMQKATKTLHKIYGNNEDVVMAHIHDITTSLRKSQYYGKHIWKAFFSMDLMHRIFLGFSLVFLGRVSGMQLAVYFSVSMFCKVGLSGFVGGILIGASVVIGYFVGLMITDRLGRKVIVLCGYFVMFFCLVAASILILVFGLESDVLSTEKTVAGYFVVAFLSLFVGAGVVAAAMNSWIIVSEIFPLRIKGMAVALVTVGWWSGNIISGELSPFLLTSLGTAGTLLLHSGVCVLAFLFILLLLPETKGQSLEQVDQLFSAPWLQRTNLLLYITCGRINTRAKVLNSSPSLDDTVPLELTLEQTDAEENSAANLVELTTSQTLL